MREGFLITVVTDIALLAVAICWIGRVIFNNNLNVAADKFECVYRNPTWIQLFIVVGALSLTVLFLSPLYRWVGRQADLPTATALIAIGLICPALLLLAARQNAHTWIAFTGSTMVISKGKSRKIELELKSVESLLSYRSSSIIKLANGKVIWVPGAIGLNRDLQVELNNRSFRI